MSDRLPVLLPAELSVDQRELLERIVSGPRSGQGLLLTDSSGGLAGPFNAMLYSPGLGGDLQEVGVALRTRTSLTARVRELAILAVAASWDSAYERHVHEPAARLAGVTEAQVRALRSGSDPALDDPVERCAVDTARALAGPGDLDDERYARARELLGLPALVELTTLVGYYATLALQLRVFRIGSP